MKNFKGLNVVEIYQSIWWQTMSISPNSVDIQVMIGIVYLIQNIQCAGFSISVSSSNSEMKWIYFTGQ